MVRSVIYDCPDERGKEILEYMKKKAGGRSEVRFHDLSSVSMEACTGCFNCWLKTPGECIFKDDAARLVKEVVNSEAVLFLCPVTWGGCSPSLKVLLDRSICRVLPFFRKHNGETHHPPRYEKSPSTAFAGYGDNIEAEEAALFRHMASSVEDNLEGGADNAMILSSPADYTRLDSFFAGGKQ